MAKEILTIVDRLEEVFDGDPWYGKPIVKLLKEINPDKVYEKHDERSHSLIELVYHMITWQQFTLQQLEDRKNVDEKHYEQFDWREIEPLVHTWKGALEEFTTLHAKIIKALKRSSDKLLNEEVAFRDYDFRYLLNGLIQHNIYHAGQLAYLNKLLS